MLFLELYVQSTFSQKYSMYFNIFLSRWYHFMASSWKYWDATSAGNDSEIFSNNNTQLKMHSHFFTLIVLLQFMHVTVLSSATVATGFYHICHLCMLHQQWDWCLLILDNIISGFFSSRSMYFLITSSDKIGISSILSDTIVVVLGVVDNFYQNNSLDLSSKICFFCPVRLIMSVSPYCYAYATGLLPHMDYWSYQVIEWFSFQIEILSTTLYEIFLNFVL